MPIVLASDSGHSHDHGQGHGHDMKTGNAKIGDLEIKGAWTRQAPPAATVLGGYATITNNGVEADRLIAASADFARKTKIHEMAVTDGVMKMKELENGLEVPAGETVALKPGSFHLMFMQATSPKEGEVVKVELTFEKAGTVSVMLPVAAIGTRTAPVTHSH